MMNFNKPNLSWLEKGVAGLVAFGKKNKTSIMTGGGVFLGWFSVWLFWKESKKAEEIIRKTEERLTAEAREHNPNAEPIKLSFKEKFLIYAGCCWPSAVGGILSTGLTIGAHKISMDDLGKAYVVSQFFRDQTEEKDKEIEKLKGELPEKKVKKIENELHAEKFPEDKLCAGYVEETGHGNTLFIEELTGARFRSSITEVTKVLYQFKDKLGTMRKSQLEKRFKDAFYASDSPYPDDMTVYSSLGLDVLLRDLGYRQKNDLGEVLEFRDYGYADFLSPKLVMDYKNYVDPDTGEPAVCFLHIKDFISPTYELIERNPL